MSLLLNCASSIVDITTKGAVLLFTVSKSMGHELPHVFWYRPQLQEDHRPRPGRQRQPGPQTSTWPQVVVQTTHLNMAPGGSTAHGNQHGFRLQHRRCSSTDRGHPHGPWWQQTDIYTDPDYGRTQAQIQISLWPRVVAPPMDINMTLGHRTDYEHLRRP